MNTFHSIGDRARAIAELAYHFWEIIQTLV